MYAIFPLPCINAEKRKKKNKKKYKDPSSGRIGFRSIPSGVGGNQSG